MASTSLIIADSKIRMDKDTGFICVTDIGNAKDPGGGTVHVSNWLRNAATIDFIEAWEMRHNQSFKPAEFGRFKMRSGSNAFPISGLELVEVETSGIEVKRGRYGETYYPITDIPLPY